MTLGPETTDGFTKIPRRANPMLSMLMGDFQRAFDLLMGDEEKLSDRERTIVISHMVATFGEVYLLGVLRELNPEHADRAAAGLADQWDSGDSLGEWVYQWREELAAGKPLSVTFDDSDV